MWWIHNQKSAVAYNIICRRVPSQISESNRVLSCLYEFGMLIAKTKVVLLHILYVRLYKQYCILIKPKFVVTNITKKRSQVYFRKEVWWARKRENPTMKFSNACGGGSLNENASLLGFSRASILSVQRKYFIHILFRVSLCTYSTLRLVLHQTKHYSCSLWEMVEE